jgi:hypothetical protein
VAVPDVVHIAREPGYRTDTIGSYRDGQFYAAIHGAHRDDDTGLDLQRERVRWYVYLHLFNAAGFHQRSEVVLAGTACPLHDVPRSSPKPQTVSRLRLERS